MQSKAIHPLTGEQRALHMTFVISILLLILFNCSKLIILYHKTFYFRQSNQLLNLPSGIYDNTGSSVPLDSRGIAYSNLYNDLKSDVPFHPYGPSDYGKIHITINL